MDKIILEDLTFFGYHGHNPEERVLGQRFVVSVTLFTSTREAGQSDRLDATINYSSAWKSIREIVEGPPFDLIEALAEKIAERLLSDTNARAVRVRVGKPWAPVKGMAAGGVAVEILRARDNAITFEGSEG